LLAVLRRCGWLLFQAGPQAVCRFLIHSNTEPKRFLSMMAPGSTVCGRVANNPAMHRRMVNGDTALGHHLLKIPQAQIVSQIPPDTEQDHGFVELPALEHCVLPHCGLNAVAETLKQNACDTSRIAGPRSKQAASTAT
jgi:hypothetical protein